MRQFFKFVFASCLGVFLAIGFLILIGVISIGSLAKGLIAETPTVNEGVLKLSLPAVLPELTNNAQPVNFTQNEIIGLHDIIKSIDYAASDNKIKGIAFYTSANTLSYSKATLLRDALIKFKESGKFLYTYGDYIMKNDYYIASISDSIFIHPMGNVEINGFGSTIVYYTDFLKKLGINMEVFGVGKYKSATEPYKNTAMSDENREQLRDYFTDVYDEYLEGLSTARNIPVNELRKIANEQLSSNAQSALDLKLIEGIAQNHEFEMILNRAMDKKEGDKINFNSIESYYKTNSAKIKPIKLDGDRIAVIYAEGAISDTDENPGSIQPNLYLESVEKILKDSKVKAVVLRVDSPGGSALASDKIHYAMKRLQDKGIPIIASYGQYAASGGYYISAMADKIVAQENTLTGSIGVFGVIPNVEELAQNKMELALDTVKTSTMGAGFTILRDFDENERALIQKSVVDIYDRFLSIVAEGRNLTVDSVHTIGQGRVYSGTDALAVGLVDEIGNLDSAIALAAEMAEIENYNVKEYPIIKDPITRMIESFTKTGNIDITEKIAEKTLSYFIKDYTGILNMAKKEGYYMQLPYVLENN